jgi:hypothetical protein
MLGAQAGAGPAGFMASGLLVVVAVAAVSAPVVPVEAAALEPASDSLFCGELQAVRERPSANVGTAQRNERAPIRRKEEFIGFQGFRAV